MTERPGLVQKRLSPHRFVQLPDRDRDVSTGTAGMGANNGTGNGPDAAVVEIPLSSPLTRKQHTQTGARRGSQSKTSSSTAAGAGAYCRGAAYGPPILWSTGGTTTEKTGLVGSSSRHMTRRSSSLDYDSDSGPGARRRGPGGAGRSRSRGKGLGYRLARMYERLLNFSALTRYTLYILPVAAILAIPIILGATVARNADIGGVRMYWFFCWVEVIWLGLWSSRVVARCVPGVYRFLGGIANIRTARHAAALRALEVPIALVCWGIIALVTFFPIMNLNPIKKEANDTGVKGWQISVKNILFALLVCSLMFLAEKILVRSVCLCYYRTQFDAKINESTHVIDLLGSLYDASRVMFPVHCREFRADDAIMAESVRVFSADNARRAMRPLRFFKDVVAPVGEVTPAFGTNEFTGRSFGWSSARSAVIQALGCKKATEALARRIWMSFVVEGRHALYLEDVVEVLAAGREGEAHECFRMLNRDGNGDISLEETILTVAEFGRKRMFLLQSVYDVDQAIHVLDCIFVAVALILGSLVSVFFVTNASTTAITAGATSLLGLCFLLSATAHEVLGSCVLLFVKRPFEVGDRVEISDKSYIVQRISLLYTVFRCVADNRTTQAANNVLNNHWIDNFTRADGMREQLQVPAHFDTTFDDIQRLRDELERFVRDKDNSRDFMPDIDIEVAGLGNLDRLDLRVDLRHRYNWSNESVRAARRSKFMCALVLALRHLGIRAPEEPVESAKIGTGTTTQSTGQVPAINGFPIPEPTQQTTHARGPSHTSTDHLNPPSPGHDEEDSHSRWQTPSASPNKRLSANMNPGAQPGAGTATATATATGSGSGSGSGPSRQASSTGGRRKATGSTDATSMPISNGVPVIAEPIPLQRPSAHPNFSYTSNHNPYSSYLTNQRRPRRFSYDAPRPKSPGDMEHCSSPVAGLFVSPEQRGW